MSSALPLSAFPWANSSDPEEAFSSILARAPNVHDFILDKKHIVDWKTKTNFVSLGQIGVSATASSPYSVWGPTLNRIRFSYQIGDLYNIKYGRRNFVTKPDEITIFPQDDFCTDFQRSFIGLLIDCPRDVVASTIERLNGEVPHEAFYEGLFAAEKFDFSLLKLVLNNTIQLLDDGPSDFLNFPSFIASMEEQLLFSIAQGFKVGDLSLLKLKYQSVFVKRGLDYIEENYQKTILVTEMAKVCGCSIRLLQKLFREVTGKSIVETILQRRLEAAHSLLLTKGKEMSVASIALQSGFFHLGRFSKAYRIAFGKLPSETLSRKLRR